jgi:hypothetical protein
MNTFSSMHTLTEQEASNDQGCLGVVAFLLLITLVCLTPFLVPAVASMDWYKMFSLCASFFLLAGGIILIVPFSVRWTKYLLVSVVLGCTVLQFYTLQLLWKNPFVLSAPWSILLRFGSFVVLVSLFVLAYNINIYEKRRTRQLLATSSLSIPEPYATGGKSFFIHYRLTSHETTCIKSIRLSFSYYQSKYVYDGNFAHKTYEEHSIPISAWNNILVDPYVPFVETVNWTVPTSLATKDDSRKDWSLKVLIIPSKGANRETSYPLHVRWYC